MPPHSVIEAPTADTFLSLNEAEQTIYDHAFDNGYALTRSDIRKDKKSNPRRWDFRCDKGGHKRGQGVIRQTSTRMTECPFELRLHRVLSGGIRLEIYGSNHNHPASDNQRQHAQYRRTTAREATTIKSLSLVGVAPRYILNTILRKDPDTLLISQDIYNLNIKARKEQLAGRTPIEALIYELTTDQNWAVSYETNKIGRINFLFFALDDAITLAQASPEVLLIDATYRTNRYNMPCIHFMTVTSIGRTASIGLAFVAAENSAMYQLAVSKFRELVIGDSCIEVILIDDEDALKRALSTTYPGILQLLCLWHVNKNVQTYVNKQWVTHVEFAAETNATRRSKRDNFMADWETVIYVKTEGDFKQKYTSLRTKYSQ